MMTPEEQRRMDRLENTLLAAYCDVDNILTDTHPTPGPNGRVRWARVKRVRDYLKLALRETAQDEVGTIPMVLIDHYPETR